VEPACLCDADRIPFEADKTDQVRVSMPACAGSDRRVAASPLSNGPAKKCRGRRSTP